METTKEDKKKFDVKEYQRTYRLKNKEKNKDYKDNYYQKNKEKIKEKGIKYYQNNKDRIKRQSKENYLKNPKLAYARNRKRIEKNPKKTTTYKRNYKKRRMETDPLFKIKERLRTRLYQAIKSQSSKKSINTLDGFGCTGEFLIQYLESLFKEGMSWKNYTFKGWHIDHIKPMSSFDLRDPEEQKKCNNYTNLQPLWWWENLEKGDKIPQNLDITSNSDK